MDERILVAGDNHDVLARLRIEATGAGLDECIETPLMASSVA